MRSLTLTHRHYDRFARISLKTVQRGQSALAHYIDLSLSLECPQANGVIVERNSCRDTAVKANSSINYANHLINIHACVST